MIRKIQTAGRELVVAIPRGLAKRASLEAGDAIIVKLEGARLVISSARGSKHDLTRLLARVRRGNLHGEVDFGEPRGREVW
jgi:antitoxin component of MazEF toxin-antitoxin module